MIETAAALAAGREMLGTPYSTYDCINFIKAILRKAPGGEKKYTVAGTNSLWRSRDLTWRQENLEGARAGMLAFKVSGEDVHHVGLVTGQGTVLHSSSAKGCVVETDLYNGQWSYLAVHRLIQVKEDAAVQKGQTGLYTARVATQSGNLRLRRAPVSGTTLEMIPKGELVSVLEEGTWPKVEYKGKTGYVMGQYLEREAAAVETGESNMEESAAAATTLMCETDGTVIVLMGKWRVAED